jgi:hypothetical protein
MHGKTTSSGTELVERHNMAGQGRDGRRGTKLQLTM